MKAFYIAPLVLKRVSVQLESKVLTGSVVTKDTQVKSTGQEVVSHDFSDTSFNQVWE